jgi:hypothetical protein
MVSWGAGTQQKTVSCPLTIHPSWCAGWWVVHCCPEPPVNTLMSHFRKGSRSRGQKPSCPGTSSFLPVPDIGRVCMSCPKRIHPSGPGCRLSCYGTSMHNPSICPSVGPAKLNTPSWDIPGTLSGPGCC